VRLVVIGDDYAGNLLSERDLDFAVVDRHADVVSLTKAFKPDIVVFDLMYLDKEVFESIAFVAMTVSLSPIFSCLERTDVLFHRTAVSDPSWPTHGSKPMVLKGLEYAVVGEHSHRIPLSIYEQRLSRSVLSIAISMGGTDAANKTLQVLERVREVEDPLLIWIMLGEGYMHSYQELVEASRSSRHEIILAKTNDSMWHILESSSLAILAGGTTTYEAVHAGLPSINTLETDRHYFLIQELVDEGACLCAGNDFSESLETLTGLVIELNRNRAKLREMHRRSDGLVDAAGASRICSDMLACLDEYRQSGQLGAARSDGSS